MIWINLKTQELKNSKTQELKNLQAQLSQPGSQFVEHLFMIREAGAETETMSARRIDEERDRDGSLLKGRIVSDTIGHRGNDTVVACGNQDGRRSLTSLVSTAEKVLSDLRDTCDFANVTLSEV